MVPAEVVRRQPKPKKPALSQQEQQRQLALQQQEQQRVAQQLELTKKEKAGPRGG